MLYTVLLLGVLYPVHNESPPPELIKFSNLGRSISRYSMGAKIVITGRGSKYYNGWEWGGEAGVKEYNW